MKLLTLVVAVLTTLCACNPKQKNIGKINHLKLIADDNGQTIALYKEGVNEPILVQVTENDFRPYIHPIVAPDGKGVLTEFSPGHHKHQTGLYWGFTRVNDRDYFHHPADGYWKKVSADIIQQEGEAVKWQTVYDMLDEKGNAIMRQTQNWVMTQDSGKYFLSLEWKGEAKTDVTIGKYDYGGLFLRMPWKEGMKAEVINAARQKNEKAEGQRAMWVDVGMQVEGRNDFAHIAIFDHPDNRGYPQRWRVDGQFGVGPATARDSSISIKNGETETYKYRMMIYTGLFNDRDVSNEWAKYTGKTSLYSTTELWAMAQQEALSAKFLTPDEAVATMTLNDGNKVNVWASEPMMTQPMAFCWDDRGRLWIAENKDYESRGSGFSNAGDSRIIILEDTNHDGKADTRKVFMEDIAFPSALAVGFDGVFVGAPPNLLFIPDRNHDDIADKDIEVRLTGWGIRDRHETLNSFHWGPDGWLYGCQGFATPSKVRKPKDKGKIYRHKDAFPENILEGDGVDINGGVWRYHPTKDKFEVVAHGFSNPWGIDYDAKGQLFISACVIPHMWYVIPGGIYHRQGGQHFNPFVYDDIKTITDHSHRSAHGGARIYQSDAFPAVDRGRIFMCNIHEHAVLSDVLEKKGSGFVAHHGEDFMLANNGQWVGFSMEVGPDGGIYALDWHDADICGQTVKNAETGRIFRIMPAASAAENWNGRYSDLSAFSDLQLAQLQTSASDWHARRARVILQGRTVKKVLDKVAHDKLMEIYTSSQNADHRLHAMWTLYVTKSSTGDMLMKALDDKDEYIRSWAIQFLGEDGNVPAAASAKMITMAQKDASPVVRLYLASAIQRVDKETGWKLVEALTKHSEDQADHNLPKMIWFGFEKMVKEDPKRALNIAVNSGIPLITTFAARRTVDANAIEDLVAVINTQPTTVDYLLQGMLSGMEGRVDLKSPSNWKNVYTALKAKNNKSSQLADDINALFGDAEAAKISLAVLSDKKNTAEQRIKALRALFAQQRKELVPLLEGLLNEPQMKIETIRAIAAFNNNGLGDMLLSKYNSLNDEEKAQAVNTLSSRPAYGWILAQAIKNNKIPRKDISANVARQLRRVVGSGFVEIWGPIDDKPANSKAYEKYKSLVVGANAKTPDINKGQMVFSKTCAVCHTLFGKGGKIGPDLTGSNRSNVDYLLANILDPSGEIQDAYKMLVVTTRDGRTFSGNLVSENDRQITMRVVGQDDVVLNKSSIQSREVMNTSMMPQGLLNNLSDQEIADLLGYLMKGK
ncbi:MAG: PmoA family protein [Chitinophagaceae bacterium]|nr:PmoA family protein [Chitinophagaceae bacterium]